MALLKSPLSAAAPSSSSSAAFCPKMDEEEKEDQSPYDHYDTPWEFKNRALAVALGQQRRQQQQQQQQQEKQKEQLGLGTKMMMEKQGKSPENGGRQQNEKTAIGRNPAFIDNGEWRRRSLPPPNNPIAKPEQQQNQRPNGMAIGMNCQMGKAKGGMAMPGAATMMVMSKSIIMEESNEEGGGGSEGGQKIWPNAERREKQNGINKNGQMEGHKKSSPQNHHPNHHYSVPPPVLASSVELPPPPLPAHHSASSSILLAAPVHHGRTRSTPSSRNNNGMKTNSILQSPPPALASSALPHRLNPSSSSSSAFSSSSSPSSSTSSSTKSQLNHLAKCPQKNGGRRRNVAAQSIPQSPQQQCQQQLPSYPLVSISNPTNSPSTKEVIAFCQQQENFTAAAEDKFGSGEDLSNVVHDTMERAEAELLLGGMPLGTHLLRRRPDQSLALSLRGNEAVLHIKLELGAGGHWVLGEGPRFRSVHSMLRAYRRIELPVRGAEQIRLGTLVRPEELAAGRGLLLL